MKVTNKKALDISAGIQALKSKNQLESKGIVFLRNNRLIKPIVEEFEEIVKALQEKWSASYDLDIKKYEADEKYRIASNIAFTTYQNGSEDLKEFLEKEIELEFITFPESDLEKQEFDWAAVELLIDYIITV